MNNSYLIKGIEIIGVLFAAFGGFLAGVAPPQEADAKFAVGLSSFLALIILFIISSLSDKKYRGRWLIFGSVMALVVVFAAYIYKSNFDALAFAYPPGRVEIQYVAGTELMPEAADYVLNHPGISSSRLLADFGGLQNRELVWTADSISRARMILIGSYTLLVLAIAGALFALTEGALSQNSFKKPVRRTRKS